MTKVTIQPCEFVDITGLPEVHRDERRTIYEKIERTEGGMARVTRSEVTAPEVVLGNHYHDFEQRFRGRGAGVLFTAPKDRPEDVTEQELPENGWRFTIPAGVIMALRLKEGAVQIFESEKDYQDGANTHRIVIAS